MDLKEFKSLIDLFFYQAGKQNPQSAFLEWLNPKNKKKFTWGETSSNIYKLAKTLKASIADGDRCLLVSENRPEWLISDIAIMLANGITVPAYTTYTEKDYKYLIEDCQPSVIIVSNDEMHDKLKNIIDEKSFIRKVITFEKIEGVDYENKYLDLNSIIKNNLIENFDQIFDVGSHKGEYIKLFLKLNKHVKIQAFEPLKEIYNELLDQFKDNKNINCHNIAIGEKK